MNKNKKTDSLLYVSFLIFISFAVYVLYINRDVLYTAQERSEFLFGTTFFQTLMSKPFGLIRYTGAWLTQLFYVPLLGASVQIVIWALTIFAGTRAFRLQGNAIALMILPIACLLTSLVDLGYWIYLFTIRGYWFSQSIGYLLMLALLWIARITPREWHPLWYVAGFCTYPVLGWFALLFVLCLMLVEKPGWRELIGLFIIFVTANIWRIILYSNLKYSDVTMAGFPVFETPSDKSEYLTTPFWMLGALSIFVAACGRYLTKWFTPILCVIVGVVFTWSFMFRDENYINEMRMVRNAESNNWKEVLSIYGNASEPTASMVMLKNVALMHEGGLLDRSFEMGNDIRNIYNPDSLHVSFLEIASPLAYYNYGMINEGFRLSFECSEQTGFSPFFLKILSQCAFANDERKLAKRYMDQLKGHPFYKDWKPMPISEKTQELHKCYTDEITGVENSYNYIINSICYWYKSDSKAASEQALFFSMLRCDPHNFWASMRNYVKMHSNEAFPKHAQEAYIMYMDKAPEAKRMMIPVSQDIYDHYKAFWATLEDLIKKNVNKKDIPEKMCKEFGDTYWYYNIFARKSL